jgi:predicted amidohydrolase
MNRLKVALAQLDVALGDKKSNVTKAVHHIADAAAKGAATVCLPEYFSTGFGYKDPAKMRGELSKLAEPIPGPTTQELQQACKTNRIGAIGSMIESIAGKFYNTTFVIDSNGKLVNTYHKVHLFQVEQQIVQPGDGWQTFEMGFGKIGTMTCYDAIFPEAARTLALAGASVIFHPANWMEPFLPQWRVATNARALENQVWMVSVNRVGKDELFTYFGRSRVVDPYGNAVFECSEKEELAVVEIDLNKIKEFRSFLNFLDDRRPGSYKL